MKVPEGVFSEANDEEGEEEQTLGIKASSVSVGVANSTGKKFYVTTFTESARSTKEGGTQIKAKVAVPGVAGGGLEVAKVAKDIELTERLQHHDREDAPPETFKSFEANSSTDTVSWFSKALIEVKIFTEREGGKLIYNDTVTDGTGLIIIRNPDRRDGKEPFLVIRAKNPRVVKFKKYRWMPHSGVALRGRRANYHPDLLTDEDE